MFFDVLGSEGSLPIPELEWDISKNGGSELRLGATIISEKTLSFSFRKLTDVDQNNPDLNQAFYFLVNWPDYLYTEARLELLSRDGQVLWKRTVEESDIKTWREVLAKSFKSSKANPLRLFEWGGDVKKEGLPIEGLADGFRFCLSRKHEKSSERLCSQRYVVRKVGAQTLLGRLKSIVTPRVLINGEPAQAQGQVSADPQIPIRFFSELTTGETVEFTSKPLPVSWSDFVRIESQKAIRIVGYDTPPAIKYQIMNPDRDSNLVELFGFQSTIKDPRKFWSVVIPETNPYAYFPGEDGGVFKHKLPVEKAPSARLRLHLSQNTPVGTYKDGVKLRGRKLPTTQLKSDEHEIINQDTQNFVWSFKATQPAEINHSSILLTDGENTYRTYYELYKGYSNELSGRASMILSSEGLILMGEVAYNKWFEDIFGWDHPQLAKQRWGVSAKYFQSFTEFEVGTFGKAQLQVLTADLKYRFTPGLWTREETHGALVSYQDVAVKMDVTDFKVPMVGVGWFWARSMPRVFDELFNYIPFMRYPKWVDMEFIYYAMSTDSSKSLDTNFSLNFHGQILWKNNFFGEAGFGIKRYAFVDKTNSFQANLGYELNTLYGTVGLGVKF